MDDTRHPVPHLGLNQQHHTAVALGDQRFLDQLRALQTAQVSLHDLVEPVLGVAGLAAQVVQHGTGVVQHLAGRADGAGDGALQVAQLGYVFRDAGQQRYLFVTAHFRAVVTGCAKQFPYQEKFLAAQQSAQQCALEQLPEIFFRPKLQAAPLVQVLPGLGGLLLPGGDFQQVAGGG